MSRLFSNRSKSVKLLLYVYAFVVWIGFNSYAFFNTKSRIQIENYNNDKTISEWILYSLTVVSITALVYLVFWFLELMEEKE
jgi:hypothetical protein